MCDLPRPFVVPGRSKPISLAPAARRGRMTENKFTQLANAKRKVYQWLLKMYREDALEGLEQVRPGAPDVADLVELLRGAGYRLCAVDIGANSSTASASAFASASVSGSASFGAGGAPGCQVSVKCLRSGLSVTMETAGDAECRCPDSTEDHSASTWSVVSSQENLSRLEVGSSLLPPVPPDVSDVVGSTVGCALRILREWPTARATPSVPTPVLPTPHRPAPLPPPLLRPMSAEGPAPTTSAGGVGGRLGARRPHHLSLDAAQWASAGNRGTPTLASPWGPSATSLPTPWGRSASPSLGPTPPPSEFPLPIPEILPRSTPRRSPPRPRHSLSPPRRSPPRLNVSPPRSRSEEPPPLPPRRVYLYTLDDYLAMKKAEKLQQEQQERSGVPSERSLSTNDLNISPRSSTPLNSPNKSGVSEPPSLTTLEETEKVPRGLVAPSGSVGSDNPKGTKVIINDATDFVTKAELTIRQIGVLMQSIKKWMIAREEEDMTEPLVKKSAKDSTESDSSEGALKKAAKGSGKKGVKKLLPTLSSKPKVVHTPRPAGPSSRFSDSLHPRLSRMGKTPFPKGAVEPIPTRTYVRPKPKVQGTGRASPSEASWESARSGSENSQSESCGSAVGRRKTICTTSLPGPSPAARSNLPTPSAARRATHSLPSSRGTRSDAQPGAAARSRNADARTKGAIPRQARSLTDNTQL